MARSENGGANKAMDLADAGWDFMDAGDHVKAGAAFKEAIESGWIGGYLGQGQLAEKLGDLDGAIDAYGSAVESTGDSDAEQGVRDLCAVQLVRLHYNRGLRRGRLGSIEDAEVDFRDAIRVLKEVLAEDVRPEFKAEVALTGAQMFSTVRLDGTVGPSGDLCSRVKMLATALANGDGETRQTVIHELDGVRAGLEYKPSLTLIIGRDERGLAAWDYLTGQGLVPALEAFARKDRPGSKPLATQISYCTSCGSMRGPESRFCGDCGAAFP